MRKDEALPILHIFSVFQMGRAITSRRFPQLIDQAQPYLFGGALKLERRHRDASSGNHLGLAVSGIGKWTPGDIEPAVLKATGIVPGGQLHRLHHSSALASDDQRTGALGRDVGKVYI
jgi:hypothetical protein